MKTEVEFVYLYKISNTENNKIYIGQSVNVHDRWIAHKSEARTRPQMAISNAINKYGEDKFAIEIIATCTSTNDADDIEIELIKQYNSKAPNGYNVSSGGKASPETRFKKYHKPTKETIEKIRSKLIGKPSWNKGTVGIMKSNSTSFKPGNHAWLKGTIGKAKNGNTLESEKVLSIFNSLKKNEKTVKEIMFEFNLSYNAVRYILSGITYAYLTGVEYKKKRKLLTKQSVLDIVNLSKSGATIKKLMELYNVNNYVIERILTGKTWGEITGIKYIPKSKQPSTEYLKPDPS